MGPGIIIPLVVLAVAVPVTLTWAKKRFRDGSREGADLGAAPAAPAARLTSNALRELPSPPWRVVYEVADDKLGDIEHVLIGPHGTFGVRTSMGPLPEPATGDPSPQELAAPAIVRGPLDDALRSCGMSSDELLTVHWGVNPDDAPLSIDPVPGHTAVDGRSLAVWIAELEGADLTPGQVDLAWQTVLTAIGRPDPLA